MKTFTSKKMGASFYAHKTCYYSLINVQMRRKTVVDLIVPVLKITTKLMIVIVAEIVLVLLRI